jgi:hypothetical protein
VSFELESMGECVFGKGECVGHTPKLDVIGEGGRMSEGEAHVLFKREAKIHVGVGTHV